MTSEASPTTPETPAVPEPHAFEVDASIRPQDDLFRHVNGPWLDRTDIPADRARYGSFIVLADAAEQAVREIIEESTDAEPGTEHRKLGDLFASFLDEERLAQLGASPIAGDLDVVAAVDSVPSLLATLGHFERVGVPGVVGVFIDNDPGRPDRYIAMLEQGGLGLPDERYYREEGYAEVRDRYRDLIATQLGNAGLGDAPARAERVFALETDLAAAHWENVRTRDSRATYNPTTWSDVRARTGGLLDHWLEGLDVPEGAFDEIVVREPDYLDGLTAALTDERLDAWRDWLAWQVVRAASAYLSDEFSSANFDFYGRVLTGAQEQRPRWKRGVSFVEHAMGEAVGRVYVERHFPEGAKAQMDALVAHLIEAYRASITRLDWMGEETRERAIAKLERFTPKIGYPVRWRDYAALEVRADDLLGNARRASLFAHDRELAKLGAPIDRDEWFMTPQTVNAYYNPGFNEIVFPAAILQFPFFVEGRDAAENFGAIGAVIGHEIGHGFDDQGSRFDGDGRLTDWWTDADRTAFEDRTRELIAQYDALEPALTPGKHVNGELTIGENIGDLGGLGIAWQAYLLSQGGAPGPDIDGRSAATRFFFSWAQAWQQKARPEEVQRLLTIDPHSPAEFRCNQIVRNLDVFHETFGTTEGDGLWLEPERRVAIW